MEMVKDKEPDNGIKLVMQFVRWMENVGALKANVVATTIVGVQLVKQYGGEV